MGILFCGVKFEVEFKLKGILFEGGYGLEKVFYENEGFVWFKMLKVGDGFIIEFKELF